MLRATSRQLRDASDLGSRSLHLGGGGTLPSDGGRHPRNSRTRRGNLRNIVEASRNDRDTNLVAEGIVDDHAEDDVRLRVNGFAHQLRGREDLLQANVRTTLEEHEHAVGTVNRRLKQRGGDGALNSTQRTILARSRADTHERRTGVLHDGLDIVKVDVDEARGGDQLGDALDAREQDLVSGAECIEHGDGDVGDLQETVVRNDDQGVNLFAQRGHTTFGLRRAAVTLEGEGASHNSHGQRAGLASHAGDHGSSTRPGAATLASGHEDHVRAFKRGGNLVNVILGGLATDGRIRAGTQAVRQFATDVKLRFGIGHEQSLRVSIDRDELNALEADLDHSVHGVNSAAADADDLDHCQVVLRCRHGCLPCIRPSTFS